MRHHRLGVEGRCCLDRRPMKQGLAPPPMRFRRYLNQRINAARPAGRGR